ncbi:MAG: ABC-2 family transporter protein [Treponemataceae bacterium]
MKLNSSLLTNISNKIKLFFCFTKNSFLSLQIYNEAVLISIIRNLVVFIMQIALWLAVQNSGNNFSIEYIVNYIFLSQMITVIYPNSTSSRIASLIESGNISMKLLRPVNIFTDLFFHV